MPLSKAQRNLSPEHGQTLLALARASIRHGLVYRRPALIDLDDYAPEFSLPRATFVTLIHKTRLRGCIGNLEPCRPLAVDVAHNAYAAAFQDPRFPPVAEVEFERLELHLSLLTPATPLRVASEAELIVQLVPFEDGLILEEGARRGTFLPSVWESLPEPARFVEHLKLKAGLPRNYWSDTIRVWRYGAEILGEESG
jgi:AmmeMemoRadiSam system protein A